MRRRLLRNRARRRKSNRTRRVDPTQVPPERSPIWLARKRTQTRKLAKGHRPAARSGLEAGDLIAGVGGVAVKGLADLYRKVWALGAPGVDVPLNILKGVRVEEVRVVSGDRYDFLRLNPSQ